MTGLLAAGTAVTGVIALNEKASLDNALGTFSGNSTAIEDARSRAKTFSLASDALLGATAACLGVALYVTLAHGAPAGERAGDVKLGFGLGGVQLHGAY
jgi:hypothetical protein